VQGIAQTSDPSVVLANKPRELSVGVKVGKSFFNNKEQQTQEKLNVFYGAVGLNYGICHNNRLYYGLGVDVEYLDLIVTKVSVPLYGQMRFFILGDRTQGLFADAKVGYILGGKQSLPLEEQDASTEASITVGKMERSLSGLYLEAGFGYRIQKFDFCVAYDYRVAHYTTDYYINDNDHVDHDDVKPIHSVMFGVRYVIF
jgi:hypothetical protein